MARRKKSINDILAQAKRISSGIVASSKSNGTKKTRLQRVENAQDRYVRNILGATKYFDKAEPISKRADKAAAEGKRKAESRARNQLKALANEVDNTKVSRSVYMGLANSKG